MKSTSCPEVQAGWKNAIGSAGGEDPPAIPDGDVAFQRGVHEVDVGRDQIEAAAVSIGPIPGDVDIAASGQHRLGWQRLLVAVDVQPASGDGRVIVADLHLVNELDRRRRARPAGTPRPDRSANARSLREG